MALLLALGTFLGTTVICLLVWLSFGGYSRHEVIQRRFEAVEKAQRRGSADVGVQLLRNEVMSSVPSLNRALMSWSWSTGFRDFVKQAGMDVLPGTILLACVVLAVLAFYVTETFHTRFPVPVLAAAAAATLPIAYVAMKRRKRLRQFEESFPEALDLLNRAIRAGHAFTTGMGMIATESPEPIAGEFRTTYEEQNFGLPLRDALQNLAERVPLVDVRLFITALLIQKETGGNLSEILDSLAHVIRDRFRIYRDVRVKSAHGRLTAAILIAMPPLLVFALGMVNPSYLRGMYDDPIGPPILWAAGAWQVLGSALLWKIIHIEV